MSAAPLHLHSEAVVVMLLFNSQLVADEFKLHTSPVKMVVVQLPT